jgi:hypothetical protein
VAGHIGRLSREGVQPPFFARRFASHEKRRQSPGLIARAFHFTPEEFFEIEDVGIRSAPTVNL